MTRRARLDEGTTAGAFTFELQDARPNAAHIAIAHRLDLIGAVTAATCVRFPIRGWSSSPTTPGSEPRRS
jgi:hypothetical protein